VNCVDQNTNHGDQIAEPKMSNFMRNSHRDSLLCRGGTQRRIIEQCGLTESYEPPIFHCTCKDFNYFKVMQKGATNKEGGTFAFFQGYFCPLTSEYDSHICNYIFKEFYLFSEKYKYS
jgi:hypothetical protein